MRAYWRHLANTIKLVLPSANPTPQPKRKIDRFSHFCAGHGCRWADWRHLVNTIELVHPSAYSSPQRKRQIDRCSRFAQLTAENAYTLQWLPLSTRITLPMWDLDPHLTWFLWPKCEPTTQTAARSVQSLLHRWPQSDPVLNNGSPVSPENCQFPWGIWTPCNTWFIGPTRVLDPNGISIASAVFAGLANVTNWQTDRPRYSVGKNRPHLRT